MLSRVADRMYWFGRYLSRVENTSRLINVQANLLLDLPVDAKLVWEDLTDIIDSREFFNELYEQGSERNVIKFMLADKQNPGSLLNSLAGARENVRTTREILPSEAWEQVNEMYWYGRDFVQEGIKRSGRHDYLDEIMNFSHQITGLLDGCMSHDHAYTFIQIGRHVESADMASRIIDVGTANMIRLDPATLETYNTGLWMNVLRSLSAFQMYRQHVPDRVNGEDVINFLMKDEMFPRSIYFCLKKVENCFSLLPRKSVPMKKLKRMISMLESKNTAQLTDEKKLHRYIDRIQGDFNRLHNVITKTWLNIK